jgi:phospholipid-binding lipoprotein MlaA
VNAQRMFSILLLILLTGQTQLWAVTSQDDDSSDTSVEVYDPLEGYNRAMFDVNFTLDKMFFRPISEVYGLVPSPARKGVRNFLTNLKSPVTFINDLLQLEGNRAGETMARALINTTVGIGGLFDVATTMGIDYHSEGLDQTMAGLGIPHGPYLILPLLGPSTPRNAVGRLGDAFMNPVNYVIWNADKGEYIYIATGVDLLDKRTEARGFTDELEKAIDPYARARSLWMQTSEKHDHFDAEDDSDSPKPLDSE